MIEVVVKRKRLKKRKIADEGIDCQIRKAKKRWLTTVSGAEEEGISPAIVCFPLFVFRFLIFFFFLKLVWRPNLSGAVKCE